MLHGRTLWELMERRVDETPDALMVVDEDMRTLTFSEFWSEAELAASGLAAAGVRSGQVVSWQLPNWIETFVLVAALNRLGVVQNPILTSLGMLEVEQVATRAATELLVVPSRLGARDVEAEATTIARRHGTMRVLVSDRALPQGDPTTLPDPLVGLVADEQPVTWLFHTAGTTAEPKVVQHTDATIAAAAAGLCQRLGLIPRDRHGFMLPIGNLTGMVWLFASLQSGCANIITEAFDEVETSEVLSREGVTLAGSELAHHAAYVANQRRHLHPVFPDVRGFPCHDGAGSGDQAAEVEGLFEVPVLSCYGSTEAPVLTMASTSDTVGDLRGVGTPLPGVELRFVQFDGTIATGGAEGELRVRAPQLMRGYADPALHAEAFDDDGFFRTGDLGRVDEHGVVSITGPVKDVTIGSAGNVSARELEG